MLNKVIGYNMLNQIPQNLAILQDLCGCSDSYESRSCGWPHPQLQTSRLVYLVIIYSDALFI